MAGCGAASCGRARACAGAAATDGRHGDAQRRPSSTASTATRRRIDDMGDYLAAAGWSSADDNIDLQCARHDAASGLLRRQRERAFRDRSHPTVAPPLTRLAEDEQLFRDSVYEFADREIRPLVREMDEQATIAAAAASTKLFELGVMGIEIPESYGGAGAHVLPLRARGRGAVARRSVDRRAGRRAEHARHQRAAALGQRRHQAALPAAAGRAAPSAPTACRRPARAATRSRCTTRAAERGDGYALDRPQALDHQRQRGRPLHRLRHRQSRRRLPRHHRVPRRARHARLHRRQEGRQARHPRQQHLRAALRGLPRAASQRARRGRQGLQGRDRDAERRPHRHRRADDRPGAGRARSRRRATRRSASSSARRSPSSRACSSSWRAWRCDVEAARLLVYNAARLRDAGQPFLHGSGDVQAVRRRRSPSASPRWPSICSAATAS